MSHSIFRTKITLSGIYLLSLLICDRDIVSLIENDLGFITSVSRRNCNEVTFNNSIKYLGYMFSSNNSDDTEMLRQMRLLYCRSNRVFKMFNKCSKNALIELCRSFCTTFDCPYFWTVHKRATFSKIRVAYNNVYRKLLGLCRRSSAIVKCL